MGICSITFQAENQEELMNDIRQFGASEPKGILVMEEAPEKVEVVEIEVIEPDPPKPKKGKRKPPKKKEPEPPQEEELDLTGTEEEELPEVSYEDVTSALRKLIEEKSSGVAAQIMEEFGGSVKMSEIPVENHPLLYSEIMKALDA